MHVVHLYTIALVCSGVGGKNMRLKWEANLHGVAMLER